ncbi:HNH/ENDO VII family nuclease [Neobacillus sp. PS3-40]|uniref:HNH/ENDO VII family nuclease n=1 Tax=Neobacillus sp. PS3-40 TaxID=3070679 RepID=UPI0027E004D5|nr:HNH/ENDO VII family nuclease [Neobacillus sp. PS3-40]WML46133.1 HNH/ENDO VII family nuclease [Neobacillus sp. PS3-40]
MIGDKSKSRNGQWDMGHTPENKYSEWHEKYIKGEITKEEFLDWYRNPKNYKPENPFASRSHKYE